MTTNETTSDELLVVKMGTATVTKNDGRLDQVVLAQVTEEISELIREQIRVVLVTSGAVGAGLGLVPEHARKDVKAYKQALSTIGQPRLMDALGYHFDAHDIICAQGLPEEHDFDTDEGRENMRKTHRDLLHIQEVIGKHIVLVLNANDFVTFEGFPTDNDKLAGLAVRNLEAERKRLVFLTDERGLLGEYPNDNSLISQVHAGIDDWRQHVVPQTSDNGTGGMDSKCSVAEEVALAGIPAHIGNGKARHAIRRLLSREDGTIFLPRGYTDER